jgi:hypothetical protein
MKSGTAWSRAQPQPEPTDRRRNAESSAFAGLPAGLMIRHEQDFL